MDRAGWFIEFDDGTGDEMRIALLQFNPMVGDCAENAERIQLLVAEAANRGAQWAITPELAICGYPPEDLLLRSRFVRNAATLVDSMKTLPIPTFVGGPTGDPVRNSLVLVGGQHHREQYDKQHLPNYSVFDEVRYFVPGTKDLACTIDGAKIGVTVCEDLWVDSGPASRLAKLDVDVIVNASASPYYEGRGWEREKLSQHRARQATAWVVLCNMVGGQDELVFDGHSLVIAPDGTTVARGAQFSEDLMIVDIGDRVLAKRASFPLPADQQPVGNNAELWSALVVGVRDYAHKNGFANVALGVSGGIDSAVTAAIAVEALGKDAVTGISMPSKFSSSETRHDAMQLCTNLGIGFVELGISDIHDAYVAALSDVIPLESLPASDMTDQNVQARIRGDLLMAWANHRGALVLTTGNKSEVGVGFMTLYGDMAGGFAPLKDVYKQRVYELAAFANEQALAAGRTQPIPDTTIEREPSAELRADQRDIDSLPPYEILDRILELYIEHNLEPKLIVERMQKHVDAARENEVNSSMEATVLRVIKMVDRAEHKRRQAPPGTRVTPTAFGRDRRMPITGSHSH